MHAAFFISSAKHGLMAASLLPIRQHPRVAFPLWVLSHWNSVSAVIEGGMQHPALPVARLDLSEHHLQVTMLILVTCPWMYYWSILLLAACELDINGMHSEALPTATAGPDEDDDMDEQLEYGEGGQQIDNTMLSGHIKLSRYNFYPSVQGRL